MLHRNNFFSRYSKDNGSLFNLYRTVARRSLENHPFSPFSITLRHFRRFSGLRKFSAWKWFVFKEHGRRCVCNLVADLLDAPICKLVHLPRIYCRGSLAGLLREIFTKRAQQYPSKIHKLCAYLCLYALFYVSCSIVLCFL